MVRSIFLITEYGGDYEDSWETTRAFGFLTHEEAERQLTEAGWKKEIKCGFTSYENPRSNDETFDDYSDSYFAEICEHKFYDKNYKEGK